jgi:hypothetical protein
MNDPVKANAFPAPLLFSARLISILFHPLFIGVWMMAYITFFHPTIFLAVGDKSRMFKFITFVNNNVVFPLLVVLLMKGLGFSQSVYLRTQKERIVPYVASITFFFWTWNVFTHQPDAPEILQDMCQGMFFSACAALVFNSYFKISMHAIGVGGLMGLMLMISFYGQSYALWPFAVAVLIAGLVCTSRLMLSDHIPLDIVMGILVGLLGQLVAWWI